MPFMGRRYARAAYRWHTPNRFEGTCLRCGTPVPAGAGQFRFDGVRWVVRHAGGTCHTALYNHYVSMESPEWQRIRRARLDFARDRCEWQGLFTKRCAVTSPLECHHRHYRTLGHEELTDLIILCPNHHRIADQRRRTWGSWPLFGTPFWARSTGDTSRASTTVGRP